MKNLLVIFLSSLLSFNVNSEDLIKSGKPWFDTEGHVINAHGGGLVEISGVYYWFGEKRNPGGLINKVNVYSSKNLTDWKYEGIALDLSKMKVRHDLERPKVIFNKKNNEYVMWLHIELNGHYSTGKAGVATSKNIIGPYKFKAEYWPNANIESVRSDGNLSDPNIIDANRRFNKYMSRGQMFRDMNIFEDSDGKAYLVYESEDDVSLQIAELSDDYEKFTGRYARILVGGRNEAPALFKKKNKYYLITSGLHGFTPTDARLSISDNIMGPWKTIGNPAKSHDIEMVRKTFYSQSSSVIKIKGKYIFLADRWDKKDLTKSTYVWLPILWENDIPYLNWNDGWAL